MSILEPITLDHLATVTGGQMLRNTTAYDEKLKTQLTSLQSSIKEVATAAVTSQAKKQETLNAVMMMAMMRR